MASFSAANVTYTLNYKRRGGNSKVQNNVTLAFGNGVLTYATGGIPLSGGNMGCPNNIESLTVVETTGGNGYVFSFNSTTSKLVVYTAASHNHTLFIGANTGTAGTQAVNATTAAGLYQSGAGATVAGIASVTGTIGGVVTAQPGAGVTELANATAISACTVIVEVVGW